MNEETFALRDVLRVLRHHRRELLAAVVLAVLAALVVSFAQPKRYTAEAQVVVGPAIPDAALPDALTGNDAGPLGLDLPAETQARIVASPIMAARVARSLDLPRDPAHIEDLTKRVQAKAVTDNLLLITVNAPRSQAAADLANGYAAGYLAYRRETARKALQAISNDLLRRARVTRYTSGEIIAAAVPPERSSSPDPIRNILIAIVLGGAAGVSLALLREHVDDRVRTRDQAARAARAPVLAALPRPKTRLLAALPRPKTRLLAALPWQRTETAAELVTAKDPEAMASEAYRQLQRHLVRRGLGDQVRRLLVTSVAAGPEASETVANLGVLCGRAGLTTMAISANLRGSRLHTYFQIPEGQTEVAADLAEESPSELALVTLSGLEVTEFNLLVLPSGAVGFAPGELPGSARLEHLLRQAGEMAHLLIIEAPPVLGSNDVVALAAHADAILLVVRAGEDKEALTARAAALLETAGSPVLGIVLYGAHQDDETVGWFDRRGADPDQLLPSGLPADATRNLPHFGNGDASAATAPDSGRKKAGKPVRVQRSDGS
ncbi:MAG TPA: Wzz/FepE/Etk N-terminal domain-containing protein [Actinomycetota bacterium]|nr:Wzz/FepE/Etk N-terminal domain-containing protein [Actinomycetota bacterium]